MAVSARTAAKVDLEKKIELVALMIISTVSVPRQHLSRLLAQVRELLGQSLFRSLVS